jgi:hypothetical protein
MPLIEDEEPVPVPLAAVRLRTVLPLIVPIGLLLSIPLTIELADVVVLFIELATLPPTVLLLHVHVTPEPVFTRRP